MNEVATLPRRSLVASMAAKYDMEPSAFMGAIKSTVIKGNCSNEQFAAFLMVAKEYDLNPLTKEIYAFPDKGGVTPIVSVDGWMNLINSHPQFDGMEFVDSMGEDGKLVSVECKMYRKDRNRPTCVTEYMTECFRGTEPWKKWPNRMLRHKAAIQAARYAFGFSGIMEPDEYERMKDVSPKEQSLSERLASRQHTEPVDQGFDQSSIQEQLQDAQSEPEDIIDAEPEPETQEEQQADPEPSVKEEEGVANLSEGQIELLSSIEEALSGCRNGKDIDAVLNEFGQDVIDAGELFQQVANKAVHQRRAEIGS